MKWLTDPSTAEGPLMLSEVDEHVRGVVKLSDGSAFENPEGPPAKMYMVVIDDLVGGCCFFFLCSLRPSLSALSLCSLCVLSVFSLSAVS